VPLGAKKADLMFLQHMLAVTRDGGMVATVMPHGVLFRGGEEKTIRAGIIDADLLEAVIGVAPNLFYGTGIPACILVLRQLRRPPRQRQARRAPGQGAVHQRRPRVLRGPGAELPAARAHREDRHHLRRASAPSRASRPSWTTPR
jgi:type I restriction enzyme M protein